LGDRKRQKSENFSEEDEIIFTDKASMEGDMERKAVDY